MAKSRGHKRSAKKASTRAGKAKPTKGYTRTIGAYRDIGVVEKKYLDLTFNAGAATAGVTSGGFLFPITVGSTPNQRVGNKITVTNFNLQGEVSNGIGANNFQSSRHRVILFWDKQCNGLAATVLDVLKTATVDSFRNLDQVSRFVIVKDKFYTTHTPAMLAAGSAETCAPVKLSWKGAMTVNYGATGGVISDIRSMNLGVIVISDLSSGNFSFNCRTKYVDL
jgi:hypothetical protein